MPSINMGIESPASGVVAGAAARAAGGALAGAAAGALGGERIASYSSLFSAIATQNLRVRRCVNENVGKEL